MCLPIKPSFKITPARFLSPIRKKSFKISIVLSVPAELLPKSFKIDSLATVEVLISIKPWFLNS